MMIMSATSRVGAAKDLSPRGPPRFFVPPSHAFLDQVGQLVDVHQRQRAPPGNRVITLEISDALREHSADDSAPFDLWVRPRLPMQVRRDGERDVRHIVNYVCAHNEPLRPRRVPGIRRHVKTQEPREHS